MQPNTDINNGLLPRIWGPHMWKTLHCISFGYPINPSTEQQENYKKFFENLGNVLPCKYCSDSYNRIISDSKVRLDDEIFKTRDNLTQWVFDLHNMVNQKLCVNYAITYDEVVDKYESFRAKCNPMLPGCVMPIEKKKESYCNEYKIECSVLPYKLSKCFKDYAQTKNVMDFENLDTYYEIFVERKKNKENAELWDKRNSECYRIIQKMRKLGIPSLDTNGLPTIHELKLIARISSTMNLDELITVANKLGYQIQKLYKFYN